jgi:hypothetical protein
VCVRLPRDPRNSKLFPPPRRPASRVRERRRAGEGGCVRLHAGREVSSGSCSLGVGGRRPPRRFSAVRRLRVSNQAAALPRAGSNSDAFAQIRENTSCSQSSSSEPGTARQTPLTARWYRWRSSSNAGSLPAAIPANNSASLAPADAAERPDGAPCGRALIAEVQTAGLHVHLALGHVRLSIRLDDQP